MNTLSIGLCILIPISAANLPVREVAPNQGKMLQMIARLINARRVLENGTVGGYSAIWLARVLPERGKVVTGEADPTHAKVARSNIEGMPCACIGRRSRPLLAGNPRALSSFKQARRAVMPSTSA